MPDEVNCEPRQTRECRLTLLNFRRKLRHGKTEENLQSKNAKDHFRVLRHLQAEARREIRRAGASGGTPRRKGKRRKRMADANFKPRELEIKINWLK